MGKRIVIENGVVSSQPSGMGSLVMVVVGLVCFALAGVGAILAVAVGLCWKVHPVLGVLASLFLIVKLGVKGIAAIIFSVFVYSFISS